jgi:hypothetical protein
LNGTLVVAIVALLVAASLGAGYVAGRESPTVTTTVTASQTPASQTPASNEVVGQTDGVDLVGCSISNDTCTFLITNVVQIGSSVGITLDETNPPCVTLNYNTGGSVDSFAGDAATRCTDSPSNFISSTGGSITLTAVFPGFGPPGPKVGQSVYGCIRYTTTIDSVTDSGCLAFLGVFTTPSNIAVATVTATQTLTTQASQATTTYAIPSSSCTSTAPTLTTTATVTVGPTPPAYTITVTVTTTATNYTQTVTVTSCTYSEPTVTSTVTTTVDP